MKSTEDRKKSAPETTNIGSTASFIRDLLTALADFAERIDRLSPQTRFILLIIALSLIMPISFGVAFYLIFLGLSLLIRGVQ